jgi:hypothetical protein
MEGHIIKASRKGEACPGDLPGGMEAKDQVRLTGSRREGRKRRKAGHNTIRHDLPRIGTSTPSKCGFPQHPSLDTGMDFAWRQ